MTRRPTSLRTPRDHASLLVFAVVFANAATQFAIQAWLTYRFAADVWDIPQPLCVSLIVALDLFAVMFMVFTYLLREANSGTKLYVWAIFAAGVGAQVLAAELYGDHQRWEFEVRIFASLPALFLAASLHGLIIWRRHRGDVKPTTKHAHPEPGMPAREGTGAERAPRAARPIQPERAPDSVIVSPPAQPKRSRRGGRQGGPSDEAKADAVQSVIARSETTTQVATRLGVSKRAVEIWVQHARANRPMEPSRVAEVLEMQSRGQVNGHRPEVGVTP